MKSKICTILFLSALLVSCSNAKKTNKDNPQEKLLVAVAWYQHSAEMSALYYQGFNIARQRLDESIVLNKQNKPLAVIVDIDETMLNNSPFESTLINNTDNLEGWYKWTSKASAKALPGALEFAKYAESKQVKIFYITNRDDNERQATLKNLANTGFPFAVEEHLFTKSDLSYSSGNTSSKAGRRARVAENHNIVLLIGDNLNDFSEIFEDRKLNDGKYIVDKNKELFGQKFIILPNPMYGAWEKPLYDYKDNLTEAEKAALLKSKLLSE
jgi:5'-nucleotidase (lipoprotein e(P4) family)